MIHDIWINCKKDDQLFDLDLAKILEILVERITPNNADAKDADELYELFKTKLQKAYGQRK